MFLIIFGLFGSLFFYLFVIRTVLDVRAARGWTQTRCRIVSSQVGEHPGSKGTTYSVDIVFTYRVGGRQYRSNRYDFMGGSSSGYDEKQAVVDRYPARMRTDCYVNPANPSDAVLDRDYPSGLKFVLLTALFPLVGFGGAVGVLVGSRKNDGKMWSPAVLPVSGVTTWGQTVARSAGDIGIDAAGLPGKKSHDDAVDLSPTVTSGYKAALAFIFLVLCGGGFATIVIYNLPDWRATGFLGGSFNFAIVLGIITLCSLWGTVIGCMQLLDPRIHVRIAPGTVRLGQDFTVEWRAQGGKRQLSELRITIECREEADYQAGKNSGTAFSTCYRGDLVNTQEPGQLTGGTLTLKLPDGVMHSFNGGRNRVSWRMRVSGRVPRWVGVKDEYEFIVLPEGCEVIV